jgi:tetratricopeptide (TPR) repeat protein
VAALRGRALTEVHINVTLKSICDYEIGICDHVAGRPVTKRSGGRDVMTPSHHKWGLAVLLLALAGTPALSSDKTPAKSAEELGQVSFPTSCRPAAQPLFERGLKLLHSFWWQEGEKTFREILDRDPQCAIAAWGLATILIGNPFGPGPSPEVAQRAATALAPYRAGGAKSEREQAYVTAIAAYWDHFSERPQRARLKSLSDAFATLAQRFPEDDEAQIFSALYLATTQDPEDKSLAATLNAAYVLQVQFAKHPNHPGVAHYLIHAYDYPAIADKGLAAAVCYADIAPSAPHALHMPSHIFTRVGQWRESAATNRRSAARAKDEGAILDRLHAMDYLVYADLQLAHDEEARLIVEEAQQIGDGGAPALASLYARAAMPARYVIERGAWQEARLLQPADSRFPYTAAMTHFARALGAARSGEPVPTEQDLQALQRIVDALRAKGDKYWATEVEVQRLAAAAWTTYSKGGHEQALALMRSAADMEDASEKSAVTPGRLVPARELLGDMLLEDKRPAEALSEYQASQTRDPNRFRSIYGAAQAALQAGDRDKARASFRRLIELADAESSRPELRVARDYLARN